MSSGGNSRLGKEFVNDIATRRMAESDVATRWPGESDEAYPAPFTTPPPTSGGTSLKPGQLNPHQLKHFFQEGYVVVEDLLDVDCLDPVRDAIEEEVDLLGQRLYDAGKITNTYPELGLFQRLSEFERQFPGTSVILHKMGRMPEAICRLWSDERLLNLAEQVLGTPEILGHPIWNLRVKTPQNEATNVPWHQDAAYTEPVAYKHLLFTAWIPLLHATEENGCMQMIPRGHQSGRVATHQCCQGGTWYVMVEEEEMKRSLGVDASNAVLCPVPYGGALLFSNLIPHRSLPNVSRDIRWSLDLRWQAADQPLGFYGLKDAIRMRSLDPGFRGADFETFNQVDRNRKQHEYMDSTFDEFDTTIQGPWMKQWEIVNHNKHTEAFAKAETV